MPTFLTKYSVACKTLVTIRCTQHQGFLWVAASLRIRFCWKSNNKKLWWLFPQMWGFRERVCWCIPHLLFFKWRSAHADQFHCLRPESVNNGSVSWDDCGPVFPDELCVSLFFQDRFPHYAWTAWSANSNFRGSRVFAYFGVTCHLHFWHSDWGLLVPLW